MKALEKDRTRRYETANGLAMDIQRHLATSRSSRGRPAISIGFQIGSPEQAGCFRRLIGELWLLP